MRGPARSRTCATPLVGVHAPTSPAARAPPGTTPIQSSCDPARASLAVATRTRYLRDMCRNIRSSPTSQTPASEDEVRAAAVQYVRKISGFTKPSQANAAAFERAVEEVTEVSARLLGELVTTAPAKDREVEAARRRARSAQRFAA